MWLTLMARRGTELQVAAAAGAAAGAGAGAGGGAMRRHGEAVGGRAAGEEEEDKARIYHEQVGEAQGRGR